MIGSALIRRSIRALLAGNDFSNCLSCASLSPETLPMSSKSQCLNIVHLDSGFTHALERRVAPAERDGHYGKPNQLDASVIWWAADPLEVSSRQHVALR